MVSWVLGIARGLLTLALMLLAVLVVVVPFAGDRLNMEVDAAFIGIGTRMTIPVRFYVDADAHRITAPAIGVDRAELIDTHGSLRFPAPKGLLPVRQRRIPLRRAAPGAPGAPATASRLWHSA